jgi:hypothetical protein
MMSRQWNPDDPLTTRFPRTSREAFGRQVYFPKRSRDYLWLVGAAVIVSAFFLIGYYTA